MRQYHRKASRRCAFSLVEIALALGLAATSLLVLLALLGEGLGAAGTAQREMQSELIVGNLRTSLLDPEFPRSRRGGQEAWSAQVYLDDRGAIVEDVSEATYLADLESGPGLGYESPYLERVRISLHMVTGAAEPFADWMLQRAIPSMGDQQP